MTTECISVILPVYNEQGNIAACLRGLSTALRGVEHEILVCYDFDEDSTLPAIAAMTDRPAELKLVRNTLGRGATFALRAGFQAARGDVMVTTMADLSDPPEVLLAMARKIREEKADVVSGSRYMKGGSQTGGPRLKSLLSRAAGLSLRWLAGLGTHDATTNFRAYSRRFIGQATIESRSGMELALELTVKAHLGGFKVDEVPSSWRDRSAGESRFRLWHWLPGYLRWYLQATADPLFVWTVFAAASAAAIFFAVRHAPAAPFWDDWSYVPVLTGREPFSLKWIWAQHFEHRIPLAKVVWIALARLTGADGRWMTGFIALLLSASSALLILGLRKFRGQTRWTDAVVPLLFLHWDHWENLTWPFQIAFGLHVFVVSLLVSLVLRWRPGATRGHALAVGAGLVMLPFCGGSALPFAIPFALWWAWAQRRSAVAVSGAALILTALYFIGYHRNSGGPPSPGLGASIAVTWQFLTGSIGSQGSRQWPASGAVTLLALVFSLAALLRGAMKPGGRRVPAVGLLMAFGGVTGLALLVGLSRAGMSHFAGFFDRYVTLSCLFPFLVYASTELAGPALVGRALRIAMALLMLVIWPLNARHAWDLLAQRRYANESLTRDVRAGLPLPLLARKHFIWHMDGMEAMEKDLASLAAVRMAPFRSGDPVPGTWNGGTLTLRDDRSAVDLRRDAAFSPELAPGTHRIHIDFGRYARSTERVRIVGARGAEVLWSAALERVDDFRETGEFDVRLVPGQRLELRVESAGEARVWAVVESRVLPPD